MSSSASAERPKLRRVQREHRGGAEDAHEHAAQRRAHHPQGDRPDQLVQRVGLRELVAGHEVGDDRVERRGEERLTRAVDGDEQRDVPDLQRARDA